MTKGKASMMLMANEAAKRKAGGRAQRRREEAIKRKQMTLVTAEGVRHPTTQETLLADASKLRGTTRRIDLEVKE